jgi:hypothetical protein
LVHGCISLSRLTIAHFREVAGSFRNHLDSDGPPHRRPIHTTWSKRTGERRTDFARTSSPAVSA